MLNWLRGIWIWAREQRVLWYTLVGLLLAVAWVRWGFIPDCGKDRVLDVGMVLQVSGLCTVWLGIEKTRKLFGFEYTLVALWRWVLRCPLVPSRRNVTLPLHGHAATFTGGDALLSFGTTDNSVEGRLRALEQNVAAMEHRFARDVERLTKAVEDVKHTHERATQAQDMRMTSHEQRLLAAQTGGLDVSLRRPFLLDRGRNRDQPAC
jgi:hypothetical protein